MFAAMFGGEREAFMSATMFGGEREAFMHPVIVTTWQGNQCGWMIILGCNPRSRGAGSAGTAATGYAPRRAPQGTTTTTKPGLLSRGSEVRARRPPWGLPGLYPPLGSW